MAEISEENETSERDLDENDEDIGTSLLPERQVTAQINGLTIYFNQRRVSLREFVDLNSRIILLHPVDTYFGLKFFH